MEPKQKKYDRRLLNYLHISFLFSFQVTSASYDYRTISHGKNNSIEEGKARLKGCASLVVEASCSQTSLLYARWGFVVAKGQGREDTAGFLAFICLHLYCVSYHRAAEQILGFGWQGIAERREYKNIKLSLSFRYGQTTLNTYEKA